MIIVNCSEYKNLVKSYCQNLELKQYDSKYQTAFKAHIQLIMSKLPFYPFSAHYIHNLIAA